LIVELRLGSGEAAWLTMAVQGGFVAGTLLSALFNRPDVLNARWLFIVGCLVGSMANGAVAVSQGATSAIVCRALTGLALAWIYPPGMKIAASWFQRRRGAALGIVVGALTLGSAFPHLLASFAVQVPWRTLILTASACAVAGGLVVLGMVRDGPFLAVTAPFDPRAIGRVFTSRRVRLATLGYLGHMWELYAMWTWMAAFAAASVAAGTAGPVVAYSGTRIAFLSIASGTAGCVAAGFVADRLGRARVAAAAMIVSAICSALAGFAFGRTSSVVLILAIVWGVAVVADSALFSALVAEHSPRDYVGTALTVQMCGGFLLTMASIRILPMVASAVGWQWAFLLLVPGPLLGAVAMLRFNDHE
jgi:MFS family permease